MNLWRHSPWFHHPNNVKFFKRDTSSALLAKTADSRWSRVCAKRTYGVRTNENSVTRFECRRSRRRIRQNETSNPTFHFLDSEDCRSSTHWATTGTSQRDFRTFIKRKCCIIGLLRKGVILVHIARPHVTCSVQNTQCLGSRKVPVHSYTVRICLHVTSTWPTPFKKAPKGLDSGRMKQSRPEFCSGSWRSSGSSLWRVPIVRYVNGMPASSSKGTISTGIQSSIQNNPPNSLI